MRLQKPPISLRLAYYGCRNRPFFHIVASYRRKARNKGYFEQVGVYDPLPNTRNEKLVSFNMDRIRYWLSVGALPTKPVAGLLGLAGVLPIHQKTIADAVKYLQTERQNDLIEHEDKDDNDS